MHEDPVRNINPNTLYGCHPLDLRSKFENYPFHIIVKQPEDPLPKISSRLRLLEKILNDISRCNMPAKEHFAEYMRQRYRRNCVLKWILIDLRESIERFLGFFRDQLSTIQRTGFEKNDSLLRKLLYVGLLDALSKTACHPKKGNRDRILSILKYFCDWPNQDKISLPHLIKLLEKFLILNFLIFENTHLNYMINGKKVKL